MSVAMLRHPVRPAVIGPVAEREDYAAGVVTDLVALDLGHAEI